MFASFPRRNLLVTGEGGGRGNMPEMIDHYDGTVSFITYIRDRSGKHGMTYWEDNPPDTISSDGSGLPFWSSGRFEGIDGGNYDIIQTEQDFLIPSDVLANADVYWDYRYLTTHQDTQWGPTALILEEHLAGYPARVRVAHTWSDRLVIMTMYSRNKRGLAKTKIGIMSNLIAFGVMAGFMVAGALGASAIRRPITR